MWGRKNRGKGGRQGEAPTLSPKCEGLVYDTRARSASILAISRLGWHAGVDFEFELRAVISDR